MSNRRKATRRRRSSRRGTVQLGTITAEQERPAVPIGEDLSLIAASPALVLLAALEDAGWGNLAGTEFRGVRGVLAALTRTLDPKTAQGKATAWQIAERAGYTERWTRRCLQVLEELGLIEWDRGGVVAGKPVPSRFKISIPGLRDLLAGAENGVHRDSLMTGGWQSPRPGPNSLTAD